MPPLMPPLGAWFYGPAGPRHAGPHPPLALARADGNPNLAPETAWGGDLGYEHRVGRTGVIGVNVFYRKVKDLTEDEVRGKGAAPSLVRAA